MGNSACHASVVSHAATVQRNGPNGWSQQKRCPNVPLFVSLSLVNFFTAGKLPGLNFPSIGMSSETPGRSQADIKTYLKLVCSDNGDINERMGNVLILQAINSPEIMLKHIPEFKLSITSLCCANPIRWGTISTIILAFTNALTMQAPAIRDCIYDLLEMCFTITQAYKMYPLSTAFRPHLLPLVKVISRGFSGQLEMSIDLLLALTRQCSIGFVPSSSFVPMMTQHTARIVTLIRECEPEHYVALAEPISSSRRSIRQFYTSVWGIVIGDLFDRPLALLALSNHTQTLLGIVSGHDNAMLKMAAKYILDGIKASPVQRAELAKLKQDMSKALLESIANMFVKAVKRAPEPARAEAAAPAAPAVHEEARTPQSVILHKQTAEIVIESKLRNRVVKVELVLSPEAGILMWPAVGKPVSKEEICHVSEIATAKADSSSKGSQSEHRLTIELHAKPSIVFILPTQPIATQWVNLIRGRMGQETQGK
jgi:hypothetical protein